VNSSERLEDLIRQLTCSLNELERALEGEGPVELAAARDLCREIRSDEWDRVCRAVAGLQTEVEPSRGGRLSRRLIQRYSDSTSPGEFFDAALDEVMVETGSGRAALVLYSADASANEIVALRNLTTEEHRLSRSLLETVRRSQASLRVSDVSREERFSLESSVVSPPVRSVLLTPIKVRGEVMGAVYLENNRLAGAYSEADERLMEQTAALLAVCLEACRITAREGGALVPAPKVGPLAAIVGHSPKLRASLQVAAQVTDSSATVLIEGESGTGKELVAQAIHQLSHRAAGPFVAVNCAAIPETLVESELFGHEKGAFTDARERRAGRVEQAAGGTLFLDEIGELTRPVQAKLLRFLQSWEFQRLGSAETLKADVRVVAATSRNLRKMMEERHFLDGLYYRLNVIPIPLPPLRDRREDIPLLAAHFLKRFAEPAGRPDLQFDPEVLLALEEYDFPGNVRELENLVQRLALLAKTDRIMLRDLPESMLLEKRRLLNLEKNPLRKFLRDIPRDPGEFRRRRAALLDLAQQYIDELEDAFVQKLLEQAGGNTREAARLSGLNRSAIYRSKQRQNRARDARSRR